MVTSSQRRSGSRAVAAVALIAAVVTVCGSESATAGCGPIDDRSVARVWNEVALDSIRRDTPAPTVHSRNLYHLSLAMFDAAQTVDSEVRADAVSFAAHRVLTARYRNAEGRTESLEQIDATLDLLCDVTTTETSAAAATGDRIAEDLLAAVLNDGSNERLGYEDPDYAPINPDLVVTDSGAEMVDPNRWQPLFLESPIAQNGLPLPGGAQVFIGSNWGAVEPFALPADWETAGYGVPAPPELNGVGDDEYRNSILHVLRASAALETGVATIDISPRVRGNSSVGTDDGEGHGPNPVTGESYEPNIVDLADWGRVIAEYWADGPDSETPPGHWNVIANDVGDGLDPDGLRLFAEGEPVDRLTWDLVTYLTLNGAMHDAAIVAWGAKATHDYVRPISMIRYAAGLGQSSDPEGVSFHPDGIRLESGLVEIITEQTAGTGERHEHLADRVGEIAVRAWRGSPDDPDTETAGVGWILGVDWVPYQRPSFVTPAFAAYVSGHSTFSRAGAEVLTALTGSPYFPDGLAEHSVERGALIHEEGPTETIVLQWASYGDAADEAGLSRIYGGIHVEADDHVGRTLGAAVAEAAVHEARLRVEDA